MDNRLGEFLRARREMTRPEQLGLPVGAKRRVPGLRREEVAMLAGVSGDYYVRLEQGRDRHPSHQVLEALSRVLDLGPDGLQHAQRLAGAPPTSRRRSRPPERVAPGLRLLLDAMAVPALVMNRHLDVLATNALARTLNPANVEGSNMVLSAFLDPRTHDYFPEWEQLAQDMVAGLRAAAGSDPDHPRLAELVTQLSERSAEFRTYWARYDVKAKTRGTKHMLHPAVGPLTLNYETLAPEGVGGQLLLAYCTEPSSPSSAALALLGSLAVTP